MDLMARQGHIIANYMRNPPKEDLDSKYLTRDPYSYKLSYNGEYVPVRARRASTKIKNISYYLTSEGLNRLIYPDWQEDTFTLGKQLSNIFNVRDRWWFNEHNDKDQTMFIDAIQSYYKKFTTWGFNIHRGYEKNFNYDFRNINIDTNYSKRYYLEV